ncbi:MAG: hypothetical protein O3C40_23355 [Planctomycetota bacterium]|nr:hypothetical protein [Planctomycetota bacterium]
MNAREAISQIACDLPDDRVEQLLDYARYLSSRDERFGWQVFGKLQLAKAYGDDEPEYTAADLQGKG